MYLILQPVHIPEGLKTKVHAKETFNVINVCFCFPHHFIVLHPAH